VKAIVISVFSSRKKAADSFNHLNGKTKVFLFFSFISYLNTNHLQLKKKVFKNGFFCFFRRNNVYSDISYFLLIDNFSFLR